VEKYTLRKQWPDVAHLRVSDHSGRVCLGVNACSVGVLASCLKRKKEKTNEEEESPIITGIQEQQRQNKAANQTSE
jgi:hypothetical protein